MDWTHILLEGFEINPQPGVPLHGFEDRWRQRGLSWEGILRPLEAKILWFEADNQAFCWISLELCQLSTTFSKSLRQHLSHILSVQIPPLNCSIQITCTHTHSAPLALGEEEDNFLDWKIPNLEAAKLYGRELLQKLELGLNRLLTRRTSLLDLADSQPEKVLSPKMSVTQTICPHSYNRRVPSLTGIQYCWNPLESPNLKPNPASDQSLIQFLIEGVVTEGGIRELLLWNYNAHPVCLGKESFVISPDYPGEACAMLSNQTKAQAFFALGAGGEVHPNIACQSDPTGPQKIGESLAKLMSDCFPQLRKELTSHKGLKLLSKKHLLAKTEIEIVALRFGIIRTLFLPLELFSSLGTRLRNALVYPVMICTQANGWEGYVPDALAFSQGGYEVEIALKMGIQSGDGEALIDSCLSLMQELG